MSLLALLLIPILLGLGCYLYAAKNGRGEITGKEFATHLAITLVVIGAGWAWARTIKTSDVEIWNGSIAIKEREVTGCCHSYDCNCHEVCSGTGENKSCSNQCDTCYEHNNDIKWSATTTNGETAFEDKCNAPSRTAPDRWKQIVVGEPTGIEHTFTNYIKGSPGSVLRRQGVAAEFKQKIPAYPQVYDWYRVNRFIPVGVGVPYVDRLNYKLADINARLGRKKQVDIIVIVVNEANQLYLEALTEAWIGGKKNDVVVVIGASHFPQMDWAGVISWSRQEEMKIAIRDRIMDLRTFDGPQILDIVAEEVDHKFIRRPMADFKYLAATIEPPRWAFWTLLIFDLVLSIGLQYYFYYNDPFEQGFAMGSGRQFRRRTFR